MRRFIFFLACFLFYLVAFGNNPNLSNLEENKTLLISGPAMLSGTNLLCHNDSARLIASDPSNPNTTFKWYSAAIGGSLLFSGDTFNTGGLTSSKTYFIESYDPSDFSTFATRSIHAVIVANANVDAPSATPNPGLICPGDSVQFVASSTLDSVRKYSWHSAITGGSQIFEGQSFNTGELNSSKTYYLQTTDINGCASPRALVTATITPNEDVITFSPAAPNICPGDSVEITASGTSSTKYYWFNSISGGTSISEDNPFNTGALNSTKTYYVEGENADGCITETRKAITVTVFPVADAVTVDPAAETLCAGDSVELTASGVTSAIFNWYTTATCGTKISSDNPFNTGVVTENTVFYVEGYTSDGCLTPIRTPAVVTILPNLDEITVDPIASVICPGDSVTLTASSTLG
ncbi:MAG: hypothetical protein ACI81S_000139, partial [Sphingobacteriales bacterium]